MWAKHKFEVVFMTFIENQVKAKVFLNENPPAAFVNLNRQTNLKELFSIYLFYYLF